MSPPVRPDPTGSLEVLQRALVRSIQDAGAPAAIAADRAAWLAGVGLTGGDLAAMERLSAKRLLTYRRRIREQLVAAIRLEIPRTAARLGPAFDAEAARFLDEQLPRSHYLIDVAFEFVDWAAPRWRGDGAVPVYLADLARHELSAFEVATEPRGAPPGDAQALELDRPVSLNPAARLRRYEHVVHRLQEDLDARDSPERRPTALLVYRDAEHDVRYLELTPMAAAILERLFAGETLRAAMQGASAELGASLDAAVLEGSARLLADLVDRGVVLSSEAAS